MIQVKDPPRPAGPLTARQWFETWPEPYRTQALENYRNQPYPPPNWYPSPALALLSAFSWCGTPQGSRYWDGFYDRLLEKEKNP